MRGRLFVDEADGGGVIIGDWELMNIATDGEWVIAAEGPDVRELYIASNEDGKKLD